MKNVYPNFNLFRLGSLIMSFVVFTTTTFSTFPARAATTDTKPNAISLADEQAFLENIQDAYSLYGNGQTQYQAANLYMAPQETEYRHWVKSDQGTIFIKINNFHYGTKTERIWLSAKKTSQNPSVYELRAFNHDGDTWVSHYDRRPGGINPVIATITWKDESAEYPWPAKINFIFTPLNLEQKLKENKISYFDDRNLAVQGVLQQSKKEIGDKDIHHRELLQQIADISPLKISNARQFTDIENKVDLDGLIKQIATNIVYSGVFGLAAFESMYEGVTQSSGISGYFNNSNNPVKNIQFPKDTITNTTYQKAVTTALATPALYSNPPKFFWKTETDTFNAHVDAINTTCKNLQKKNATETDAAVKKAPTPMFSGYNEFVGLNQQEKYVKEHISPIEDANTQLANAQAKTDLNYIAYQSVFSPFWAAQEFEEMVGHFDAKDCVFQGKGISRIDWQTAARAKNTVKQQFVDLINQNIKIVRSNRGEYGKDKLQDMIISSPLAVKIALKQRNIVSEYALVSKNIFQIYVNDKFNHNLDMIFMTVGFAAAIIAGFVTGGAASAGIFYLMVAMDAVTVTRSAVQWYDGYFLEKNTRESMTAKTIDQDHGRQTVDYASNQQSAAKKTIVSVPIGYGIGYGIGKGVQMYKNSSALTKVAQQEAANAFKESNGLSTYKFTQPTNDLPTSSFRSKYLQRKLNPGDEIQIGEQNVKIISQENDNLVVQGTNGKQTLSGSQLENAKFAPKTVTTTKPVVEPNEASSNVAKTSIAAGGIKDFKSTSFFKGELPNHDSVELFYHNAERAVDEHVAEFTTIEITGQSGLIKERAIVAAPTGHLPDKDLETMVFKSSNYYQDQYVVVQYSKDTKAVTIEPVALHPERFEYYPVPGEFGPGKIFLQNNQLVRYTTYGKENFGLIVREDGIIEGIFARDGKIDPTSVKTVQFVSQAEDYQVIGKELFHSPNVDASKLGDGYLVVAPKTSPIYIDQYGRIGVGRLENGQATFNMPESYTNNPTYISNRGTNVVPAEKVQYPTDQIYGYRAYEFTNQNRVMGHWRTYKNEDLYNLQLIDDFPDLSKLDQAGVKCGTGTLNCTGYARSMDDLLRTGEVNSVPLGDPAYLPEFLLPERVKPTSEPTFKEPTWHQYSRTWDDYTNAEQAAVYYGSKVELFESSAPFMKRLDQLPEGGTAVVFERSPSVQVQSGNKISYPDNPYWHVFNVKKFKGEIVFFDAQEGIVTEYTNMILSNKSGVFTEVKVVETTHFQPKPMNESVPGPVTTSPVLPKAPPKQPNQVTLGESKLGGEDVVGNPAAEKPMTTSLVPLQSEVQKNFLHEIENVMATEFTQPDGWYNVVIEYQPKNYPALVRQGTVIQYDTNAQRFLLQTNNHYHDFIWVDAHEINIIKLSKFKETLPTTFFNSQPSIRTKAFRKALKQRTLKSGDILDIGKGKFVTVEAQRGIVVVVREDINGTVKIRRLTKTETENAYFRSKTDEDPALRNLAHTEDGGFSPMIQEIKKYDAQFNEAAILCNDELETIETSIDLTNQPELAQAIWRIRTFEATRNDFNILWLHSTKEQVDKIEKAYNDIFNLDYQMITRAEITVRSHGYQTQWVYDHEQLILELLDAEGLPIKGSIHDTRVTSVYFDPFIKYREFPEYDGTYHMDVVDLHHFLQE